MRKLKNPAAASTTATRDKLKNATANHNPEEIDLQLLADSLAPGESVQIATGFQFSKPTELQFDPDPAPRGWEEEFGRVRVHPRTAEIVFHRAFLEGPARPWQTLEDKEALIALSDAWKAYPHLHSALTTLAFQAWRFSSIRPSPLRMNEAVRALWNIYCASGKERNWPI
jgi:hypothetical protein